MTHALTIESGEKYRVDSGTTETHARLDSLGGELVVSGHLILTGEEPRTAEAPTQIDLPMQVTFRDMNTGIALFLIGSMATTLSASWVLRNWAAGVMWGIAFVALIVAGVLGMGLEVFWMALMLTLLMLIVGMVVRWAGT